MRTVFRSLFYALPFLVAALVSADLIVLLNGKEYEGELVGADDTTVHFRIADEVSVFQRSDVVHIRLQKLRKWATATRVDEIDDAVLQEALRVPITARDYPGAGTMTLYTRRWIALDSAYTWTIRERRVVRILGEHGEHASIHSVTYDNRNETCRVVHAFSVRPDGSVAHLNDTAIQQEAVYSKYPQYDRVTRMRFALPEGRPGTVVDVETEVRRTEPLRGLSLYDEILFGGWDPMRETIVEVMLPPPDVEEAPAIFSFEIRNDPTDQVKHTVSNANDGRTIHRFRRARSPQRFPEPTMPPQADVLPRLALAMLPAPAAPGQVATLVALDAAKRLEAGNETVELPAGVKRTPEALADYVNRTIAPMGVPPTVQGFRPASAAEIMRSRQGTELDRAHLLRLLIQTAHPDRTVDLGWCRPRTRGRLASFLHLDQFSRPAVVLEGEGGMQFLLPGNQFDAPTDPASRIFGTLCWVPSEPHSLHTVSVPQDRLPAIRREVRVRILENGDAKVRETVERQGNSARSLREWRNMTEEEVENEVRLIVSGVDSRAELTSFERVSGIEENADRAVVRMEYTIPHLADTRPTLCALQLPWLEYSARSVGRSVVERKQDLFWRTPFSESVTVRVAPPEGFEYYSGPEPQTMGQDAKVSFAVDVAVADKRDVRVEARLDRQVLSAKRDFYPDWKRLVETRAGLDKHYLVWRRPSVR